MTSGTHAERIIALLGRTPGLDDDEIAQTLAIEPRQTVNKVCHRLAEEGVLERRRGDSGKIVNRLAAHPQTPRPGAASAENSGVAASRRSGEPPFPGRSLLPTDLARTLLVIPCSKAKRDHASVGKDGACIIESLPVELAQELQDARRHVREKTAIDESTLVPAWQRYDGSLYRAARPALHDLAHAGSHIVILSGGYGVVLATEPIGGYNRELKPSWWPHHILERVLIAYAVHHRLSSVRAFASSTSAYRRVLQRVRWREAGIGDAVLVTPEAERGGTRKSPASIGEALVAMRDQSLTTGWKSSYGLGLHFHAT